MSNIISVITSDIVGSTKMSETELKELQNVLNLFPSLCIRQYPSFDKDLFTSFNNYRGDEYQIVLSKPEYCIRIAVLLRALMFMRTPYENIKLKDDQKKPTKSQLNNKKLYDIRSSIAIGPKSDVLDDNGEVFVLSGHGLDALKSSKHAFDINTAWTEKEINEQLKLNVEFIEMIMSRWTPVQGRIAGYYLMKSSRDSIIKKNPVTSSAISQALAATNVKFIKRILDNTEDIIRLKLNSNTEHLCNS